MTADGGRLHTAQAVQACAICKTRKKKCNKSLPSCGYCTRKDLECVYALAQGSRNHATLPVESAPAMPIFGARLPLNIVSSRVILSAKLSSGQTRAEAYSQVYHEVYGIIRATGQFVDDISARYFQGFHYHLPVIARTLFYNNLISLGTAPAADFCILLLTISLISNTPALGYQCGHKETEPGKEESLYLSTRSLYAQVQVSYPPSIPLIQAGLLLAVYEYIHGRPDDAFMTIAGCARMAYATRIHVRDEIRNTYKGSHDTNTDLLLQAEEAANTWWGIVICERLFFSEVTVHDQPLVTAFPDGNAPLPIEIEVLDQLDILNTDSIPNIPMSCLTSPRLGGFSRTAQATCFLDQVFKSFDTSDIDSRLLQLDRIDTNIQAFLLLVVPQCQRQPGGYCSAINIAIRALFNLHWHILSQYPNTVKAKFKPLDGWHKRSQEVLDTITKMVVDTAESLIAASTTSTATQLVDTMPPIYPYVAHAALRLVQSSTEREDLGWRRGSAERVLQTSLDKYAQRWSVSDD